MSQEVTLPVLGESVSEGTISRWLKKVGETVAVGEPIVEISTDKVDTEVPSPVAGVVMEIKAHEDETVSVGAVLAIVGQRPDPLEAVAAPSSTPSAPAMDPTVGLAPDETVAPAADSITPQPAPSAPAPSPDLVAAATPESAPQPPVAAVTPEPAVVPVEAPAVSPTVPAVAATPQPAAMPTPQTPVAASVEPSVVPAPPSPAVPPTVPTPNSTIPAEAAPLTATIVAPVVTPSPHIPAVAAHEVPGPIGGGPYVTPLVRKLADEAGIDLATVRGSGVGGRIRKQDILDARPAATAPGVPPAGAAEPEPPAPTRAVIPAGYAVAPAMPDVIATGQPPIGAAPSAAVATPMSSVPATAVATPVVPPAPAAQSVRPPAPVAVPAPVAPSSTATPTFATDLPTTAPASADTLDESAQPLTGTTEKVSRLRATIARRMVESLQTSAQLTATVEVDLTRISQLRAQVKDEFKAREGVSLTALAFIAKAAIEALKQYPKVNATIDLDQGVIHYPDGEHLGIAVDTAKGLLVPVIKNAGNLSVAGLARNIADLAARTRGNRISPDDVVGGTFTITNYGSTGTLFDTPIINQPQVAILGTGAITRRPVVVTDPSLGEIVAIRDMAYLSLSYDHRLVDGADASRFLSTIKARLEAGDFGSEF
ncbi:MAG: 2-oxo acid dehydrogenase subunit E2 [Propionibacteriaceae bacterium]|jgi:2-oxoglutarate dehydrogenase E2 component (dihydrolipoamide succinyltransferase)|nr:2-oxo acid dehydrogenase subunit E2 [Propionibacteriaceae bacterium]